MRYKKLTVTSALALVFAFSMFMIQCSDTGTSSNDHKDWTYEGDTGPGYWGDLDSDYWLAAHGKNQSPIDISTNNAIATNLPNIQFHYELSELEIENNGHTIEAIPHTGSYILINSVKYDLLQFHFHAVSEHTLNGNHFPLEGHFVHKNADGDLAVIGLFFEAGLENLNFKPIWDHLPTMAEEVYELHTEINANDLLPLDRRSYQYSGSLTTPPCSEGVKWFMLSARSEMSQAQINAFSAIYDHNYRPVQLLNARQLLLDSVN